MFENDTVVLTFTANDADQPGTNNSRVLYYIDRRDDNQLYELDSTTVRMSSVSFLEIIKMTELYRESCMSLLEVV